MACARSSTSSSLHSWCAATRPSPVPAPRRPSPERRARARPPPTSPRAQALFLLISINDLYWQALIPLFGLYYLDTEKTNFLILYLTVLSMTLLFDAIHLCGLPQFRMMEGKQGFAESIYIVIFLSKVRDTPRARVPPPCSSLRVRALARAQFACVGLFGKLKLDDIQLNRYPAGDDRDPTIAE